MTHVVVNLSIIYNATSLIVITMFRLWKLIGQRRWRHFTKMYVSMWYAVICHYRHVTLWHYKCMSRVMGQWSLPSTSSRMMESHSASFRRS